MKVLASDFDNTLYFYTGFKKNDLKAIKDFQNQGHKFGVCTGRSLDGILRPSKHVDITYDFYICVSGGYIVDKDKNVIFESSISMDKIREVFNMFQMDISIVTKDCMYYHFHKVNRTKSMIKSLINKFMSMMKEPLIFISDLDDIQDEYVIGYSFHFPKGQLEEAKTCMDIINKNYSDYMSAHQNNEHIDVCGPHCSKGHGIEILEDYFHTKDIAGIGDSWNDLSMLEKTKYSYTFDYAPQDVKDTSDCIVKDISMCIEDFLHR